MKKSKLVYIVMTISLLIDQITKYIFTGKNIVVIKNFFNVFYCENTGAAWSIFKDKIYFLVVLSFIVMFFIMKYSDNFKMNSRNKVAFGLLYGGIIGNLMDRLLYGYVKDFLSFRIFGYEYPIFNIADSAIVIGVVLIIVAILKKEDNYGTNSSKRK